MCLPTCDGVAFESASRKRQQAVVVRDDNEEDDSPRVTFRDKSSNQIHEIPTALSCLGGENPDRRELWYNKDDIASFRRQAQSLSQQIRDGSIDQEDDQETTRGLELRVSFQRQDRKQMVVKRILDAQDDDATPQELAQIALGHSVWSKKLALAQAHKDYYAVYHPNLSSVLPEMPALLDCRKDVAKRSLLGSSLAQSGRRVRCRMF